MSTTYDWHTPQADPAGDAEQTAAAYASAALAVAQAHITRRTARVNADAADRALDAARDDYSPVLGADRADGPAALAAWHAAAPFADTLPDAATAQARAESALRRSSPTAMLRYDTLTAEGVIPAEAMRTASVDMPPPTTAGQGADQVDPAVRYRAAVHAALDTALADAVLADPSWPALAGVLDLAVTDAGTDPVQLLADVAGQRNLGTARNPAAVLRYRLDPTPTPGDVLAANYPLAVADAQPRRTAPGEQDGRTAHAQTQTRSRSRRH